MTDEQKARIEFEANHSYPYPDGNEMTKYKTDRENLVWALNKHGNHSGQWLRDHGVVPNWRRLTPAEAELYDRDIGDYGKYLDAQWNPILLWLENNDRHREMIDGDLCMKGPANND